MHCFRYLSDKEKKRKKGIKVAKSLELKKASKFGSRINKSRDTKTTYMQPSLLNLNLIGYMIRKGPS